MARLTREFILIPRHGGSVIVCRTITPTRCPVRWHCQCFLRQIMRDSGLTPRRIRSQRPGLHQWFRQGQEPAEETPASGPSTTYRHGKVCGCTVSPERWTACAQRPATKKSPDHKMIRGCPGLSAFRKVASLVHGEALCRCSGRSSDSRIILAPRLPDSNQWHEAAFVPGYSGGPVSGLHGVPFYSKVEPELSV